MKYITKKDAIEVFLEEHKDYLVVSYDFFYKTERKQKIKNRSKKYLDRYKKVKKLRDKGLTLREVSIEVGNISHEMIRLILKNNQ